MVFGITDIATFIAGTIFIILLPGPNSLYVMSVASRFGIAAGYRGACGIFLGNRCRHPATGQPGRVHDHQVFGSCLSRMDGPLIAAPELRCVETQAF